MSEALPAGSRIRIDEISQARHHLFLCVGPDCCDPATGDSVWEELKRRVKAGRMSVLRTKAACVRICAGGPWLLIYPDGIWYGGVTLKRLDRILSEHIGRGVPIREWICARSGCGGGYPAAGEGSGSGGGSEPGSEGTCGASRDL